MVHRQARDEFELGEWIGEGEEEALDGSRAPEGVLRRGCDPCDAGPELLGELKLRPGARERFRRGAEFAEETDQVVGVMRG